MNQIVWKIHAICLTLWRVFHSIRFKVNKVGVRRYSFFMFVSEQNHVCF